MKKKYLVLDIYDTNNTKLFDFGELRELLLEELKNDTLNNYEDRIIIENNINIYEKLVINNDADVIIKELYFYGWDVKDIENIEKDVKGLRTLFKDSDIAKEKIDNFINLLEETK